MFFFVFSKNMKFFIYFERLKSAYLRQNDVKIIRFHSKSGNISSRNCVLRLLYPLLIEKERVQNDQLRGDRSRKILKISTLVLFILKVLSKVRGFRLFGKDEEKHKSRLVS